MTEKTAYKIATVFFSVFLLFVTFIIANLFIQGPLSNMTPVGAAYAASASDDSVISRIAPIGKTKMKGDEPEATTQVATAAPAAPTAGKSGDEVYTSVCSGCHGTGVLGAPKKGNKADWEPRMANGIDALVTSAINGKGMMPPRGGNAALTDGEIKAAIEFMNNY